MQHPANGLRRMHLLSSWTNISGQRLATIPSHRLAYRLLQRRDVLAELPLELGLIYHEWFLELVEHLDQLPHSGIEKTHRPQQDLRCSLDACRLANLLEDYLNEL